jgi:hypothetical protein
METKKKHTLVAGERVAAFLNAQVAALAGVVSAAIRAKFDAALAAFAAFEAEQGSARRTALGITSQQEVQRQNVVEQFLQPIAQAAKMALQGSPDLPKLVVPSAARLKINFVARATEVSDAAALHEQELIGNGLRPTFLTEFRNAIAALDDSTVTRYRQVGRRKAATAGIDETEADLRQVIKMLDTLIRPALKSNPSLLADWTTARRIRQVPVTPLANGSGPTSTAQDATDKTAA